jgi:cell division protein FtsA
VHAGARAERSQSGGALVLDLGAHKALAAVATGDSAGARILGWAERDAALLAGGMLADLRAARSILGGLLAEAQARAGVTRLASVVAGVGGGHVRCVRARGSARLKIPVVLQPAHLDRALDAAADIGLPRDHEVLHVLPTGYLVDGARAVRSPLGLRARHVVAEAAVVTVRTQVLDALQRVLEDAGYELVGAAAEPLAAARAALSPEDRQRGALLVDLGAETTAGVAYRDGAVQSLAWVPAGGAHVTRDVAFALQLETDQAETLKRRAAHALVESVPPDRQVEVERGAERLALGAQTLAGIVEARMEEVFAMLRDALRAPASPALGARVVLAGGGARLRGAVELAEQVFECPARLASPAGLPGWREAAGDPACCTVLGLVEYAARSGLLREDPPPPWTRALHELRRWVNVRAARERAARDMRPGVPTWT